MLELCGLVIFGIFPLIVRHLILWFAVAVAGARRASAVRRWS